jgi:hypothetical protein
VNDIARWIKDRLAADRDLDRPALAELAATIGVEQSLWRPYVRYDEETRFYQQLYRDPNVDVWLICWMQGQETGYHDHDRSSGAVFVCEGVLFEDFFQRGEDGWIREKTNVHQAGGHFTFDAADIHGVRHPGGQARPATSIHCYSPALWRMGHYEPDDRGMMRRVAVTYADELLGAV